MPGELTQEQQAIYHRQSGIVDMQVLSNLRATVIGAGAIGSFAALTVAKMGIGQLEIYDSDTVSKHNLPNQFFEKTDLENFKVGALQDQLARFTDTAVRVSTARYVAQSLLPIVICAVDSMAVRAEVWKQFKLQPQAQVLIEARMGGQVGIVYTIRKRMGKMKNEDIRFYRDTLHSDAEAEQIPCTQKAILYNVDMIAGLIGRSLKSIANGENFPREVVFDAQNLEFYKRD